MASLTTTDCLAEGCRGLILHEAPRIVDIRNRRWQYSVIVFCASETELQSVAPVVDAAGAIYFSASADHTREKSGGKRALELERNPGVRLVAPAAMIMAVVGGVQIYSLFHDRGHNADPYRSKSYARTNQAVGLRHRIAKETACVVLCR